MHANNERSGSANAAPRMRIILHGKRALDETVRAAVERLRSEGAEIEVRVTWEPGDSERFAAEAAREGVDTVVAGGGDGTLNTVVRGLLDSGVERLPALGLLPLGTANDFATGCGIPLEDAYAALHLIHTTKPRPIDIGQAGEHYFVNVATGGFGTQITAETPDDMKDLLGGVAYLLTGIQRLGSVDLCKAHIEGDEFEWTGDFYALAVGNGRLAGGGVSMCADALLDDGLFEVNILPDIPIVDKIAALGDMLSEGMRAVDHYVIHKKLSYLKIDAPEGLQINMDGEPIRAERIEFRVLAGHVLFHLPDTAPLVGENNHAAR